MELTTEQIEALNTYAKNNLTQEEAVGFNYGIDKVLDLISKDPNIRSLSEFTRQLCRVLIRHEFDKKRGIWDYSSSFELIKAMEELGFPDEALQMRKDLKTGN